MQPIYRRQPPPRSENTVDRMMSDFFHSKAFKLAAIFAGSLFGFMCLSVLCIILGMGGTILAAWNSLMAPFSPPPSPLSFTPIATTPSITLFQSTLTSAPVSADAPLPTVTEEAASNATEWVWRMIDLYKLKVEMPSNWILLEINRRTVPEDPYNPNDTKTITCAEYKLVSPDGQQVISISQPCGFADGEGGPCPKDITIVASLGNNYYMFREPTEDGSSFIYDTTEFGAITGTDPLYTGYWCITPFTALSYQYIGKTASEIQDFSTVDRIMLSMLSKNK